LFCESVRRLQEVDGVDHVSGLVLHRHGAQGAVTGRVLAVKKLRQMATFTSPCKMRFRWPKSPTPNCYEDFLYFS
jgi:hypothetical protein